MNDELFDAGKCAATPRVDTETGSEILELTLEELRYVAGGYDKPVGDKQQP